MLVATFMRNTGAPFGDRELARVRSRLFDGCRVPTAVEELKVLGRHENRRGFVPAGANQSGGERRA
jgi:hypothetical protein